MTLEAGTLPTITAQDMIKRAYQILGDLGIGEALTADQLATGLNALNGMLSLFSIEKLMIYEIAQTAHTWPSATASRTIGASGDFNTRRPDRIENGSYFKDSAGISYPVEIVQNREVYDRIEDKTVQAAYPEILMYDPSYPLGTLYVYPVPNQALTFYINQWNPLQIFETATEQVALPPGYRVMIENNLAIHLESETGLVCPPRAAQIAATSKAAIKRQNNKPIISETETAYVLHGRGRSDIYTGQ